MGPGGTMSVTSLGSAPEPEASVGAAVGAAVAATVGVDPAASVDLRVVPDNRRNADGYWPVLAVAVGLVAAAAVSFGASTGPVPWACAAALTLTTALSSAGSRWRVPARTRVRADVRAGAALGSLVCLAAVGGAVPLTEARWSVAALVAGTAATVAGRVAQPRRSTKRIVVVGTRKDVESYAAEARRTDVLV